MTDVFRGIIYCLTRCFLIFVARPLKQMNIDSSSQGPPKPPYAPPSPPPPPPPPYVFFKIIIIIFYRRFCARLKSGYMGLFCCRSSRSPVEDKDIIPLTVGVEKELTFDTSDTGPGKERLILSTPSMPWTYTGP